MSSSSEGGGEYRYDVRERRDDRLAGRGTRERQTSANRSFVEKAHEGALCPRSLPLVLLNKKVEVGHVATWQVFIHKLAVSEAQVERLEGEAKALKQTHNGVELRLLVAEKEIESLKEDLQRLKQAQQETFNKELEGLRDQLQHAEGRAQGASKERDALQKLVRDVEAKTVKQQREYKGKLQIAQTDVARATRELEAALAARARAEAAPTKLKLEIETLLAQNEKLEEQGRSH